MKVSPAKPHSRTGLYINRQYDRLWSGEHCVRTNMASEPWACVGRTELHKSKAGGRHLIKQAFLSYKEIAGFSRCCCKLILLKPNLSDRSFYASTAD